MADSRRALQVEVIFEVTGQRPVVLPPSDHFVNLEVDVPAVGAWSGDLELFDQTGSYLEELLLTVGPNTLVKMRFWEHGHTSPYFVGGITVIQPEYRPEGVGLLLGLVSKGVHNAVQDIKPRGFLKGANPSDVVRSIALERGWKIENGGIATVVDAANVLDHPVQTTTDSDYSFIMNRILPYAVDAQGRHFDFRLVEGLKPIVYFQSSAAPTMQKQRRTYTYLRDPNGEVISFTPSENTLGAWLMGGGAGRFDSVDSLSGSVTEQQSTTTEGIDGVVALPDAQYVAKTLPDSVARRVSVPGRSLLDTRSAALHHWSKFSEESLSAALEVRGTHDVNVGEYIEVNFYRRDNTAHPYGGLYRVISFKHIFGLQGWTTTFELVRHGQQSTPGMDKIIVKSTISPVAEPPQDTVASTPVRVDTGGPRRIVRADLPG